MGIKPDDRFVLPLCSTHHRHQHAIDEADFWEGCDPVLWALTLFSVSGDHEEGERIVQAALRSQQ